MVKSDGPRLSLSDAVSQAARSAGVTPITSSNILQDELETPELQEAYGEQVYSRYLLNLKSSYHDCMPFTTEYIIRN